jgi:DNA-binding beta-propeller fold protein YncE
MKGHVMVSHSKGQQSKGQLRAALVAVTALAFALPLLVGCAAQDSTGASVPSGPHVVATMAVTSPLNAIITPTRMWLLGGPSRTLTEVDPTTNKVTRIVRPPHPAGWGAYVDGSLWLASYNDNLVMEMDADTGQVRRVIEPSRKAPLNYPVGIAATGTDVWVVGHEPATLTRIDARTGKVTAPPCRTWRPASCGSR